MSLVTCAKDLKFYSWPDVSLLGVYESSEDFQTIKAISWCKDGENVVAVRSRGHPVILVAPIKMKETIEPIHHIRHSGVTAATFTTTNSMIALGTVNGEIKIYDAIERQIVNTYQKLPKSVQELAYLRNDAALVAGCSDGRIILYGQSKESYLDLKIPYSNTLTALKAHKYQDNLLAASSKESYMCVWDAETSETKLVGKDHHGIVTDLAFDDSTIASVSVDNYLISYDLRVQDKVSSYNLACPLSSISFLADAYEIAVGTCDGQLRSYDRRFMTSPVHAVVAHNSWIRKIAFPAIKPKSCDGNGKVHNKKYKSKGVKKCEGEESRDTTTTPTPASGDYSPSPDEDVKSASDDEVVDGDGDELRLLVKKIEKQIRAKGMELEEKISQKFYMMRIESSKQFIALEEKIDENWRTFISNVKRFGMDEDQSTRNGK